MSYWALNAIFLAVVAVVAVAAAVRVFGARGAGRGASRGAGGAGRDPRRTVAAIGITLAGLLALTAVFDNVMIGVGLVGYDPDLISRAFVGIAPLEDFAYAIAAAVLLPSLWLLMERRPRP